MKKVRYIILHYTILHHYTRHHITSYQITEVLHNITSHHITIHHIQSKHIRAHTVHIEKSVEHYLIFTACISLPLVSNKRKSSAAFILVRSTPGCKICVVYFTDTGTKSINKTIHKTFLSYNRSTKMVKWRR